MVGKIKTMIDDIIALRSKGNPAIASTMRIKLKLKASMRRNLLRHLTTIRRSLQNWMISIKNWSIIVEISKISRLHILQKCRQAMRYPTVRAI